MTIKMMMTIKLVTMKRDYRCCFAALTAFHQRGKMSVSMSMSMSVMGGWVGGWTMSRGEQDGNVFLAALVGC